MKEALMALLADFPDGSEIRIPAPVLVRTFDKENSADPRWHDHLQSGLACLIPGVAATALMLIMIGFTILGARWLASDSIFDQISHGSVIADHQKQQPVPVGRFV